MKASERLCAQAVATAVRRAGGKVFGPRPFDLTLFGVRSADARADTFDDFVGVLYYDDAGLLTCEAFTATTDPGTFYRTNPLNVSGVAILAEGFHPGIWKVGVHKGYPAFQQKAPARVYRDNDRDVILETPTDPVAGMYGINLHRASSTQESTQVGKWSAGCQVVSSAGSLERLLTLGREQIRRHGSNSFSYVLIRAEDL